ncbi:MAG: helix-turn-helix domain-containing protein [Candidatus Chisholmbacteria bacterium]|nr:helix-turn-helix domain-containing protein [Candidatus Chisholmbacteria bacterium]
MGEVSRETKKLYTAILKLKSLQEAEKFFRDLLTLPEIGEFSKRFQIAKLLWQNAGSYETIAKKLKVSTTTVTRVAHWLNHGRGGYRLILERLFGAQK